MKYTRGSEWRRWDFHIHTPGTNKNDCFTGSTVEEKWDNYYKSIDDYICDGSDVTKKVVALGITDYLSIENYEKIVRDNRLPSTIEFIFPNVEMRLTPVAADSPVNIHFLFDPSIVDQLHDRFFSQLKFTYSERSFSATKSELIYLGKAIDPNLSKEAAYREGVNAFVPNIESIKNVFKDNLDLRRHTIVVVSNSSTDGVSGVDTHPDYCNYFDDASGSQLAPTRQSIYQFADAVFSSSKSDIEYFLGKRKDNADTVIKKCGSLKPCIWGSDAHKNDRVLNPIDKRYCWIKADPTFSGLQQILYEPESRVRIQELKPETKPDYYVIDSIKIIDDKFQSEPIVFNDKLNCIIGGKSTGKSLLLDNLALAIDEEQVRRKYEKVQIDINKRKISTVEVIWKDGYKYSNRGSSQDKRKIVYIPQTYLNRLSDDTEELTEIDDIIEEIILLNQDVLDAYKARSSKFNKYKPELEKKIYDMMALYNKITNIKNEQKELGTRDGIINEIRKLNIQAEVLSKEAAITEEEMRSYDTAVNILRCSMEKLKNLNDDIKSLESIDTVLTFKNLDNELSENTRILYKSAIEEILLKANESWITYRGNIIANLEVQIKELEKQRVLEEEVEIRLGPKIKSNVAISELTKNIQIEKTKLKKLEEIDKQLEFQQREFSILLNDVVASSSYYQKCHKEYTDIINQNKNLTREDMEFNVDIIFRKETYVEKLKSLIDQRTIKTIIDLDNFMPELLTQEKIKELIMSIIIDKISLKKNITKENALRDILSDWYNTSYTVKMDGDIIQDMSPGKKALVLLKLLISLAESKCPILIDQPEDDLDNRSIFDDLIVFLRQKKIDRQIIVATHNANIVVGGDAEEIIVANQRGKNSPNKSFQFEYRTGSIECDIPMYNEQGTVEDGILNSQGIQQHICNILEGGEKAFALRKNKYHFKPQLEK